MAKVMYRAQVGGYLYGPTKISVVSETEKMVVTTNGYRELKESRYTKLFPTLKEAWLATIAAAQKHIEEAEETVRHRNSDLLKLHREYLAATGDEK